MENELRRRAGPVGSGCSPLSGAGVRVLRSPQLRMGNRTGVRRRFEHGRALRRWGSSPLSSATEGASRRSATSFEHWRGPRGQGSTPTLSAMERDDGEVPSSGCYPEAPERVSRSTRPRSATPCASTTFQPPHRSSRSAWLLVADVVGRSCAASPRRKPELHRARAASDRAWSVLTSGRWVSCGVAAEVALHDRSPFPPLCAEEDSNLHDRSHRLLRPTRLPAPPPAHVVHRVLGETRTLTPCGTGTSNQRVCLSSATSTFGSRVLPPHRGTQKPAARAAGDPHSFRSQ
jgi:hypothetical protein